MWIKAALELIGLDVIIEDISQPMASTGGVTNEINTTPGLQHHDLVSNREQRTGVAEQILDYIFSRQAAKRVFAREVDR